MLNSGKRIFSFLLVWLFSQFNVSAQTHIIDVDPEFSHINLLSHSRLSNSPAHAQLSEMLSTTTQWHHPRIGWDKQNSQSLWLHFKLQPRTQSATPLAIVMGNPTLAEIDYYAVDQRGRIRDAVQTGSERPFSSRPVNHRKFIFPLELDPLDTLDIYIHIRHPGNLHFPIQLWRSKDFFEYEQSYIVTTGIMTGALALLSCYFLITYVLYSSPIRFWTATQSLLFLVLYLNLEGIWPQFTHFSGFIPQLSAALFALILFVSAKIAHYLLQPIHRVMRWFNYILGPALLLCVFFVSTDQVIEVTLLFATVHFALLSLLNAFYGNPVNSLANRLFVISWLAIYLVMFTQCLFFLFGELMTDNENLMLMFMALAGLVFQAIATEAHSKIQQMNLSHQQNNRIHDLSYFYQLFQNSAEGLYTSNLDGKLLTINPAMCQLFGYGSQSELLEKVQHTSDLYANEGDRQQLVNEVQKHQQILGREIRGRRADGSEFWFSLSVQLQQQNGQSFLYGSIFDIDAKKKSDLSLEYLATHDSLTSTFNRREFENRLEQAIVQAQQEGIPVSLLYLDLDQFKLVNDTCGHKAGDQLLRSLSDNLQDFVAERGLLARLGGDEFAVLLKSTQAMQANALAEGLLERVKAFRFEWESHQFQPGISIGIAHFDENTSDGEHLLSKADAACYVAKEQGRNRIHLFSEQDSHRPEYASQLNWLNLLNRALEHDGFELYYQHYQPLSELGEGHHYEILLRLQDQEQQYTPGEFYPVAEKFKLTTQIDKWVIANFCQWLTSQPDHLASLTRAHININALSLQDPSFAVFIQQTLEAHQLDGALLCFEINESQALQKPQDVQNFINELRPLGCKFALDNFALGLSSSKQLKQVHSDYIKIDQQFIQGMLKDPIDYAMVKAIHDIAVAMGIQTFAPYVENKALLIELGKMGIHFAQGYGLALPQALSQFEPYKLTS